MTDRFIIAGASVERHVLDNGFKLILQKTHDIGTAFYLGINVGSRNDGEKYGLAHLVEHVLFNKTYGRTHKQVAEIIDKLGDRWNGDTNLETLFSEGFVLNSYLEEALCLLADFVSRADFKPRNIGIEKSAIIQEIRIRKDEVDTMMEDKFDKTIFKRYPERFCTTGTPSSLNAIKREDILEFYNTYFVPNNMTLAIVGGGVKRGRTRELVESLFGKMWPGEIPDHEAVKEPNNNQGWIITEQMHVESAYVMMGTKLAHNGDVVNIGSKGEYMLEIIKTVLTGGEASKLYWLTRNKAGHCYSMTSDYQTFSDMGKFFINFGCAKSRLKRVVQIINTEMEKLCEKLLKENDLDAAKEATINNKFLSIHDVDTRADQYARMEMFGQGLEYFKTYKRRIRQITPTQIREFCKTYLRPELMTTIVITP